MKNSLFQIIVILLCVFISGCLASIVFFAVYFFSAWDPVFTKNACVLTFMLL